MKQTETGHKNGKSLSVSQSSHLSIC